MVSSEVQRTLVKSPPELWAEISDPESLARHLGEFGEIRITRVHPEQRVEWETDDARGSVAIKPSGWGTKVKLTVTRELPPSAQAATQPAVATEPLSRSDSEEGFEAKPAAAFEADHAPTAEAGPEDAVGDDAAAEDAVAEDSVAEELVTEDLPDEEELAPGAVAAAPLEQAAPAPAEAPAEAAEIDLPKEARASGEWASEHDEDPLREPRRGFFARLFGRRRSARLASREADRPALPSEPDEAAAHDQLARLDEDYKTESSSAETVAPPLAQPLAGEPLEEGAAQLEQEPLASLAAAAPPAPLAGSDAAEDALFEELHEHLAAADDPLVEPAGAESAAQRGPEMKGAEEVAAEQVTAVLTGVLDRLGAAHHRPFSRS